MDLKQFWSNLKRFSTPELLFEKWISSAKEELDYMDPFDPSPLFENIELIEQFSNESNLVVCVFDMKSLSVLWNTDNIEDFFGYTNEEFKKTGMLLVFKGLHPNHRLFLFQSLFFGRKVLNEATEKQRKEYIGTQVVGLRATNPKTGIESAFFLRQHCIKFDENGNPLMHLCIIENCSHLLKGDRYWGRFQHGKTDKMIHHYYSNEFTTTSGDVISARELEILKLLNLGLNSNQIAEMLFLSSHTIDKHRKNMVKKTGSVNTTALLQIAKMCKII
jgi:DNA-binding CsgD family transcriptional regulator